MDIRKKWLIGGIILAAGIVTGCSGANVKRVDVDKQIDLSGRWNDTDARLVAEEMLHTALNQFWLSFFQETKQRKPVIIVGDIVNRSHEHINTDVFVKALERNLINSGKVKFVASPQERQQVRTERTAQQEGYTAPETIKQMGRETGADFMLAGSINSVKDTVRRRYVILYQVNLELIDLETNEKVWFGQSNVKKTVKRSAFSL